MPCPEETPSPTRIRPPTELFALDPPRWTGNEILARVVDRIVRQMFANAYFGYDGYNTEKGKDLFFHSASFYRSFMIQGASNVIEDDVTIRDFLRTRNFSSKEKS